MTGTAPPVWRWQTYGELGSTQDAAVAAARRGEPDRLAVLAHRQTAGRGSRGRLWTAPEGNLNLSALLRPVSNPASDIPGPGRWALLAGIALHDALAPHADALILKWPNDLLLNGAKLGGVLIDCEIDGNRGQGGVPAWVVMGFGANLRAAPSIPGRATACLGRPVEAVQVAAALLAVLDRLQTADMAHLRAAWLQRAHPIGTELRLLAGDRHVAGRFAGLSEDGGLRLEGQPDPIRSGEVFAVRDWGGERSQALQSGLSPCC